MGRRTAGAAGAALLPALLAVPLAAPAQRPAVSPPLARVWARAPDTTLSVWLFARSGAPLDRVVERAAALGARVRVRSRWLHAVSIDAAAATVAALAQAPDIARIQPLGRFRLPRGAPLPRVMAAADDTCGPAPGGDPVYGPSAMPFRQLNLFPLPARGADGRGVRVALLDAGFDTAHPAFSGVVVTAQRDFVFGDDVVRDEPGRDSAGVHQHGTAVWSLFAADVPGRLRGIAPAAAYLLAKTEDVRSETRVEEDNFVAALEWADSIGVDVVSTSLGYLAFDNGFGYAPSELNGDVAVTTVAADAAARRGIIVVAAAGNSGPAPRSLGTPADGDSVLAVGAEDSLGVLAAFSSRGPSGDGRIKPDFTAPGVAVCVVTGPATLGRVSGTSFATPLLAAGATLLKQLRPTLSPIELRDTLRATASNRAAPDNGRGWGRPDFAAAAGVSSRRLLAVEPVTSPLTTITATFAWTPVVPLVAPIVYRLRVARDSTFTQVVLDTIVGAAESLDLRRPLKPGPMFWRVYARDAAGDTAGTGRIGPLEIPAWATLTTLDDPAGVVIDVLQPTFAWTSPPVAAPPGPFTYDLAVRRLPDTLPVFSLAGITATSLQLPVPLERNAMYRWSLVAHAGADTSLVSSRGTILVVDGGTPTATLLYQNFPNPFPGAGRDATCLWFDLAAGGRVELEILDLRGHRVRRFIPGPDFPAVLPAGRYGRGQPGGTTCDPRLMWDGRADDGHPLPAGVYLSKLKAPGLVAFKRIVYRGR